MSSVTTTYHHHAGLDVNNIRLLGVQFTDLSAIRLVNHLKQVYELLSSLEQTSTVPPVSGLSTQLMHKRVFEHRKPEVRTYVAANIAEILRLTVEKQQFDAKDIQVIFSLFERVLTGLSDTKATTYQLGVKVINNLIMSQAAALLIEACCGASGGGDEDGEQLLSISDEMLEPLISYVSACFNVLNDKHDRTFQSMMLENVVFILEELDDAGGVPQPVMDVVLSQLIVELREGQGAVSHIILQDESGTLTKTHGPPKSYKLAQEIIIESASFMATEVVRFVNSVLNGTDDTQSDVADHIHALVYELLLISRLKSSLSDTLLLTIIPTVKDQLQVKNFFNLFCV